MDVVMASAPLETVKNDNTLNQQYRQGQIEIDEYPIQLEPFHIVYHHHQDRTTNFEAMEEMDVLSATRHYLGEILEAQQQGDNANKFKRLLLYLFVRQEDETQTKVAYSGTAFYADPPPPSMQQQVKDSTWLSFLGANKTDYLLYLTGYGIMEIDSVTLLNVGGGLVGVDPKSGQLISAPVAPTTADTDRLNSDNSNQQNEAPDTSMNSDVSMTIYLCAIIVPIAILALLVIVWVARKIHHDVIWKPPENINPDDKMWQASERLEETVYPPMSSVAFVHTVTNGSQSSGNSHTTSVSHTSHSAHVGKVEGNHHLRRSSATTNLTHNKLKKTEILTHGNTNEGIGGKEVSEGTPERNTTKSRRRSSKSQSVKSAAGSTQKDERKKHAKTSRTESAGHTQKDISKDGKSVSSHMESSRKPNQKTLKPLSQTEHKKRKTKPLIVEDPVPRKQKGKKYTATANESKTRTNFSTRANSSAR